MHNIWFGSILFSLDESYICYRVESWLILPTNYARNRIQWHPKQADHYYMSHYLVYNTVQIHIITTVIFPFDQKDASTRTHPEFTQTKKKNPQHFEEKITMSIASIITLWESPTTKCQTTITKKKKKVEEENGLGLGLNTKKKKKKVWTWLVFSLFVVVRTIVNNGCVSMYLLLLLLLLPRCSSSCGSFQPG